MPEHYDWQTEDDSDWDRPSDSFPSSSVKRRRIKRWGIVILGFAGFILASVVVFWRVQDTLDEAEAGRTADILSSYQLIEDSIQRADSELFTTLLSGADLSWAAVQQDLFRQGWLLDRRAFGLGSSPIEITEPVIELSPELNSAVVSNILQYKINDPEQGDQIVSLRNDSVYRLGQRWLLSPPREDFWGGSEPVELDGRILTLRFPERDRTIAQRMFDEIDQVLVELCQSTDYLNCPADLRVELELSQDPESMIANTRSYFTNGYFGDSLLKPGSTIEMSLPTPTLVGIPINVESQTALTRGYAAHASSAVVNRFTDDACCANDVLLQAFIRNRLVNLGAMPWPVEQVGTGKMTAIKGVNYDLQLMCHGEKVKSVDIVTLDSSAGTWRIDLADKELVELKGLPNGEGVVLLEVANEGGAYHTRLFIYKEGHELVLFERDLSSGMAKALRLEVRDREQLILLEIPQMEQGFSEYHVYELKNCTASECGMETHSLVGRPYWSPDGNQWLVRQNGLLWLHDEVMSVRVSDGFAPFWIDTGWFGYVRQAGDEQYIISSNTIDGGKDAIITVDSLRESLPDLGRGTQLRVGLVVPDPVRPATRWYILAFLVNRNGHVEEALIMDAHINSGQTELVHRSSHLNSIAVSPAGGKLAATFYNPTIQRWQILIHGATAQGDQTLTLSSGSSLDTAPTISWSPDDNWLAIINNGVLTVWSQALGDSVDIVPPTAGCVTSAWVRSELEG